MSDDRWTVERIQEALSCGSISEDFRALLITALDALKAEAGLRRWRCEQDCRYTMGDVADLSGKHCPPGSPCTHCEHEAETERLLQARDEAALGLERYAKDARDAQREVEEMRSTLRRRPNHDETISAILDDEVIERLGLDGRHSSLQVTRLCDELNRLREAQPRWVAVEERLPKAQCYVLVALDGDWEFGYHDGYGHWYVVNNGDYDAGPYGRDYPATGERRVTHWMPLPPLPEEDA